jgi:hypothetical protein
MTPSDDVWRRRRGGRRNRRLVASAAAAAVAATLGVTAAGCGQGRAGSDDPGPAELDVPVWYDANGLHHGGVVEQTAVDIVVPEVVVNEDRVIPQKGALALVRSGALYADPATGDVWFHPWGGHPRIVGRDSEAGPGGDPDGDTAAWFEESDALNAGPGELVVYDTAAGREISRTTESHGVADYAGGDHYPPGNGFRQVSAEHVVWTSGPQTYSHDVRTGSTSVVEAPVADVDDGVNVFGDGSALVLRAPGRAERRYPELESHVRLSPSGSYVLAVEGTEQRHAAAIADTRSGELWRVPENAYPWIAWSYGDIALVDTEDELLACDPARRACERLPAERPFLLPTN